MNDIIRRNVIKTLWQNFQTTSFQFKKIDHHLKLKTTHPIILDHFALIDLPGPHTGIFVLKEIFNALGFCVKGNDYLAQKQNDFCWMAEKNIENLSPYEALPQIVVADFRLDELPTEVRNIIYYYSSRAPVFPFTTLQRLLSELPETNSHAEKALVDLIVNYLAGRDWPLPSTKEFHTVKEFNELLAWVLILGRQPNHFTLSVHLLNAFTDLNHFQQFIVEEVKIALNTQGGIIKGNQSVGIAQMATLADTTSISLQDGDIDLSTSFVEFVWRYPLANKNPLHHEDKTLLKWNDYFTGFVGKQANHVIESLYE